jgi:6-phosphogluconolactonase
MQPSLGTLHTFDDAGGLAQAAFQAFVDLANATIDSSGVFRVALSGGSTPKRLYEMLGQADLPWDRIEWFWGDERNVPHDHADSNYKMVQQALLGPAKVPAANVFAVPTSLDSPATAALDYEQTLRDQFRDQSDRGEPIEAEWPEFDLVLLGMGDDAHTASLFPETPAIDEGERWFVENWVPKFDAFRLTLTAPAINAAANVWFMITGENKRAALEHVWGPLQQPKLYPSQLIHPEDGVLWWMVAKESLPPR